VAILDIPVPLSSAIVRSRQAVVAVLAQSLLETGFDGRTALAWEWALTGTRPSPIILSLPPGIPPSRSEILAEAEAEPEGSTAPPGVPTDFCDQLREARSVLAWLIGDSDQIPVDDENRGRFIGARSDFARTDAYIREVRDRALTGLKVCDLPEPLARDDARRPWRWRAEWMNAAWLRGVGDLLDWVLGDRIASPLCGRSVGLPASHDLTYEEGAAEEVAMQGHSGGVPVDPGIHPPPQYGEGIQAAIRWLRGEVTKPPVDNSGPGSYS
jgi:hypothetical protein